MKTALLFAAGILTWIGAAIGMLPDASQDHGREVYTMQKCALCHSISGAGGNRHALDGVGGRLKPEDIRKWIRTPKEMKTDTTMKSYPNLPEKDLNDLVEYLMTLK